MQYFDQLLPKQEINENTTQLWNGSFKFFYHVPVLVYHFVVILMEMQIFHLDLEKVFVWQGWNCSLCHSLC